MTPVDRDRFAALAAQSVEIILENQAPSGAYPAGPSFEPYRFCWLRDGAFIADAASRAGEVASAEAFFDWCSGVLLARRIMIEELVERRGRGETIALRRAPAQPFHPGGPRLGRRVVESSARRLRFLDVGPRRARRPARA